MVGGGTSDYNTDQSYLSIRKDDVSDSDSYLMRNDSENSFMTDIKRAHS